MLGQRGRQINPLRFRAHLALAKRGASKDFGKLKAALRSAGEAASWARRLGDDVRWAKARITAEAIRAGIRHSLKTRSGRRVNSRVVDTAWAVLGSAEVSRWA